MGEYKAVKFKKNVYGGRIPAVLAELAKAFFEREGPALKHAAWDAADAMDIFRARRELETTGKPPADANAHLVAALIVDFFESLMPEDAPLSRMTADELELVSRFYTGSEADDRLVDDAFGRVSQALEEPQRSVFAWLVDFLASASAGDPEATRRAAEVFGPLCWTRHSDVKHASPDETAQAELHAKVVLYSCILFARRSRRASNGFMVGNPANEA